MTERNAPHPCFWPGAGYSASRTFVTFAAVSRPLASRSLRLVRRPVRARSRPLLRVRLKFAMMESRVEALQSEVSAIQHFGQGNMPPNSKRVRPSSQPCSRAKAIQPSSRRCCLPIEVGRYGNCGRVRRSRTGPGRDGVGRASLRPRRYTIKPPADGCTLGLSPRAWHDWPHDGRWRPYEPVPAGTGRPAKPAKADPSSARCSTAGSGLTSCRPAIVAIPSMRPVQSLTLTSDYGIRTDPFRGGAAMHAGVDIPGAMAPPYMQPPMPSLVAPGGAAAMAIWSSSNMGVASRRAMAISRRSSSRRAPG